MTSTVNQAVIPESLPYLEAGLDEEVSAPRPLPATRPWGAAALAPLLLAGPWLIACRAAGAAPEVGSVVGLLVLLLLATSTVTDLLWRRIFNWTTCTALAWGTALVLAGALLPPSGARDLLGALRPADAGAGLLLGFLLTFTSYLVFHGGAGDVKLVAVLGLLLGPRVVVELIFFGYLFGGAFGVAYLVWQVGPVALLLRLGVLLGLPEWVAAGTPEVAPVLRTRLPMAPFLTAGVAAALLF